jgi:prolyl-tRNA synthetase
MGVIVEKCHDDKGIIWPHAIAPFETVVICASEQHLQAAVTEYEIRKKNGEDVALDDRDI